MDTPSIPDTAIIEHKSMHSPLGKVIARAPVTCGPQVPVKEVLELINRMKVGSMIVADPATKKPLGIFTLRDLLQRVALGGCRLDTKIGEVMTTKLVTSPSTVTAYQAALIMSRHGIRHLLVVDGDELAGVVSQNDLFNLQRSGVKEVTTTIRNADSMEALQAVSAEIRRLARQLMTQGVNAESLTQYISTLNDLLTLRIIELMVDKFDLPTRDFCWIAMGSEGRFEQTLSTDQDNGIIFVPPEGRSADEVRNAMLPFAKAVNDALDSCGFPLCKGNIMASNPMWCLSLDEWKGRFSDWIFKPVPDALLNAAIFFDFRPLYGNDELAETLREWLLRTTESNSLFLYHMARNALECRPPLGMIRDFVYTSDSKEFPHTIDLKMFGARPFIDAARLYSLRYGISHTNTAERLRLVGEQINFAGDDLLAVVEGFFYVQNLRLRRQIDPSVPREGANRIDPDKLNELDRHILKEAFKQARKLQTRMALDYKL